MVYPTTNKMKVILRNLQNNHNMQQTSGIERERRSLSHFLGGVRAIAPAPCRTPTNDSVYLRVHKHTPLPTTPGVVTQIRPDKTGVVGSGVPLGMSDRYAVLLCWVLFPKCNHLFSRQLK